MSEPCRIILSVLCRFCVLALVYFGAFLLCSYLWEDVTEMTYNMLCVTLNHICVYTNNDPPISIWPHLFRGAGHEKRRGEQLKWSLVFRLYVGSFPCAQLQGPFHTALLCRVCVFFVYLTLVFPFDVNYVLISYANANICKGDDSTARGNTKGLGHTNQ